MGESHCFVMFLSGSLLLAKVSKDVAALVIGGMHQCDDDWHDSWLIIGGTVDLLIPFILLSCFWGGCNRWRDIDGTMGVCLFFVLYLAYIGWISLGFVLWSKSEQSNACSTIILTWCIVETLLIHVPCCFACIF